MKFGGKESKRKTKMMANVYGKLKEKAQQRKEWQCETFEPSLRGRQSDEEVKKSVIKLLFG